MPDPLDASPRDGGPRAGAGPAVVARGVARRFGSIEAVSALDVELARGEITALVGANGAGKTTLLRLLAGVLPPSSGQVTVLGVEGPAMASPSVTRGLRRRVAYVAQDPALDGEMTGFEILTLMATLHGVLGRRRRLLVEQGARAFGLTEVLTRRVDGWSGGQRRRLHLAAGLVHDPELLLLDEPAAGLDPAGREALWAELVRRAAGGRTVALVTHDLAAVERHAHRVLILRGGRCLGDGHPAELEAQLRGEIERSDRVGGESRSRPRGAGHARGRRR